MDLSIDWNRGENDQWAKDMPIETSQTETNIFFKGKAYPGTVME